MKHVNITTLIILLGVTANATASCKFVSATGKPETVIIKISPTLSFPRDTPNGATLYESPAQTIAKTDTYVCTTQTSWGVKASTGSYPTTTKTFPIGDTGLGWEWILDGISRPGEAGAIKPGTYYEFKNAANSFRLVKIGEIKSNAKVPAGIIGNMKIDNLTVMSMNISSEVKLVSQSCETPDIKVDMGERDLGDFSESGSSSKPTAFSIRLNNCPSGINKVMYSLAPNPTTPAWNASLGIVELNQSSTAKGIALQILDSNQAPLALNKNHVFNDYSSTGGNFSIPLSARYYRTAPTSNGGKDDPGVTPGAANTEVTFVMSYL
ncbi:fimbrial protein [Pseudomonas sp. ZL2]